jgi:hypothetical protein
MTALIFALRMTARIVRESYRATEAVVIGAVLPVGVGTPGFAGAYLEAHLAWSWVAWKTPSRP